MSTLSPIVVVDDDIDHALIVRLVLAQVAPEAEIHVMTDPRALAQRLMDAPRGALVLMDRNLDGRDGIELLPLLRSERPDLRAVLLSAALSEPDRIRALAAGAYAAIEKPSSVAAWRDVVTSLVASEPTSTSRAA